MGAEAVQHLREDRARLSPRLREFLEAGERVTAEQLSHARQRTEAARRELEAIFARYDALIVPAARGEAPLGLDATGDPVFSRTWTLLGTPCVTLPLLKGPSVMPVGLQLIGPRRDDARLLGAAAWVAAQ